MLKVSYHFDICYWIKKYTGVIIIWDIMLKMFDLDSSLHWKCFICLRTLTTHFFCLKNDINYHYYHASLIWCLLALRKNYFCLCALSLPHWSFVPCNAGNFQYLIFAHYSSTDLWYIKIFIFYGKRRLLSKTVFLIYLQNIISYPFMLRDAITLLSAEAKKQNSCKLSYS